MRRRIAIVTDDPGWHGARLRQALARRGFEAVFTSLNGGRLQTAVLPPVVLPGFEDDLPAGVFVRGIQGGTLEQLILRLDLLHACEALGVTVYNPPRAIELSVDKGIASLLLSRAGVPTPPTWVTAERDRALAIAAGELAAGHRLVSKPLFGSQGEGVERHQDLASLETLRPAGGVYYLQRFVGIDPPEDYRVFVVGGRVIAAMRRRGMEWRTNVARGGRCEAVALEGLPVQLALDVARILGMRYAGVDLLRDGEGRWWVIEVNGIPAWKGLQSVCEVDVTEMLIQDFLSGIASF
ncbi:tetrahydromethanopterin:alpha-L-glutamate ligase [Methylomarinovum tepidoasis]|uniref:Tetrahydromethanopterin:alpha-L-glutamate ligase n=1 Tax=Methylomarinovum tepidoasis TaxID=2840183 RepID=A0AAU9D3B3_9GAMM|nr:RimK family alpha-L-glutamate ligase [Methylomarinovum sp. IN45]BCX89469.1 tetrahydromethanopterin:alpha-L-glutamate ligase [Methylomarinovum sp. IN45]